MSSPHWATIVLDHHVLCASEGSQSYVGCEHDQDHVYSFRVSPEQQLLLEPNLELIIYHHLSFIRKTYF